MKERKEPEVSSFTDSKQVEDEEAEHPSISSSASPTEIIGSKPVQEQKETNQSSSTRLKSLEKQKETDPPSCADSNEVDEATTEHSSSTSSTSFAPSPSARSESNKMEEQIENETSFSTHSKEVEESVGHPPPSLVSATSPTSTGLQNVERQRENELLQENFKKLVYDFHRLVMTPTKREIKLDTGVSNYTEKILQILSDNESKELEGIELVTLCDLLNAAMAILFNSDCIHICHRIAETLIRLYNSNQLSSRSCNDSVFIKLVKNFTRLCRHEKSSIEFENAYEIVADDPLTVNFSNLVRTLSKYKEYDTNLSIQLACNMISKMLLKPGKDGHPFFCDDADDEESYNFVLGMYLIAKAVFTNYETNKLEDFNAEELLYFTSAFLKLFGRDDSQKSVRRAVVCIAKRWIQIVTDLKGKYGSVLGYFHVFCNAFSLWNQEDESGSLEQALICMADVVNAQFELKNLSDFFLFDLSILCKSFRKLLDTPSVVKAGLSIAKFVAGYDLNELLKSNMECLVYFVKSFSSCYEKYNELKSFKDAVHAIAYGTSSQLQNLNYAMGCRSKDLANLALCISRYPIDDSKQHSNMQIALVSIAQCLINIQMKKLASCRVKDLGKLTMAFRYWRDNSVIAQSIIFIAQEINVRDKNELRTSKYKYLNYLLTGLSTFFFVNFDGLSSKVLILAACKIVKTYKIDDLKEYEDEFLLLLDNHFSRFSDDWECHEAVIIIRQVIRQPKLIFGKTALNVFAEIMEIDESEIKRLLENGPLELSKLALSCSSFMDFDDSCHSLQNAALAIARCISDTESNESEKSVSNLKSHSYDPEVICNFVLAFTKYTDEEFRAAMSYFAKYIISCGDNVSRIFSGKEMCNLVIAFREWCDNFPSVHLNEFDSVLDILTEYVVNYTT
ncbi:hypothetical protein C0J52_12528 [Blattella germanica]|nr:hypothetical protein C0J52_12528 [Blattella germanica]